jgi:hypothetical protein
MSQLHLALTDAATKMYLYKMYADSPITGKKRIYCLFERRELLRITIF